MLPLLNCIKDHLDFTLRPAAEDRLRTRSAGIAIDPKVDERFTMLYQFQVAVEETVKCAMNQIRDKSSPEGLTKGNDWEVITDPEHSRSMRDVIGDSLPMINGEAKSLTHDLVALHETLIEMQARLQAGEKNAEKVQIARLLPRAFAGDIHKQTEAIAEAFAEWSYKLNEFLAAHGNALTPETLSLVEDARSIAHCGSEYAQSIQVDNPCIER